MSNIKTSLILIVSSLLLLPVAVHAAQVEASLSEQVVTESLTVGELDYETSTTGNANDGILELQKDVFIVSDENGNIYFNQILSHGELPSIKYDFDTVETYEFDYQGKTFRNRIVK